MMAPPRAYLVEKDMYDTLHIYMSGTHDQGDRDAHPPINSPYVDDHFVIQHDDMVAAVVKRLQG